MQHPDEALESQDGSCKRGIYDTAQPGSLGYPG